MIEALKAHLSAKLMQPTGSKVLLYLLPFSPDGIIPAI